MLRYRTRPAPHTAEDAPVEVRPRDVLPTPAVGHVPGAGVVTATLPNGRTTWFRLDPAPVPVDQMNRLARQAARADVRHALHTRATARSIETLTRSLAKDVASVNAAQLRGDRALGAKLRKGDAKLEQKITKAAGEVAAAGTKSAKQLTRGVGRIRRRAIWDSAVIASAAPLFAAYGQRDNPFGSHNVTLAAALGVWLFGDELTDMISGRPDDPPTLVRDVDLWSYIAPFGNLLAGWWLMRDEQHQRFVTGTATTFGEVSVRIPQAATLAAEDIPRIAKAIAERRDEYGKRLAQIVDSRPSAAIDGVARAWEALAKLVRERASDDEKRSFLRLYGGLFIVGGPLSPNLAPSEKAELVSMATGLGLPESDAVSGELAADEYLPTLDRAAAMARWMPFEVRREIIAILSAFMDGLPSSDASMRAGLRWLVGALGVADIEVVHTHRIDLAFEHIASGYEREFRALAIAATAALVEGATSDALECAPPRVTASVDAGVLYIEVIVSLFGKRQRKALPAPTEANTAPAAEAAAQPPAPTTEPAAPAGAAPAVSVEAARRPGEAHVTAIREGRVPITREAREVYVRDIAEWMLEFLWTTPPKVAWIVDTQSPK